MSRAEGVYVQKRTGRVRHKTERPQHPTSNIRRVAIIFVDTRASAITNAPGNHTISRIHLGESTLRITRIGFVVALLLASCRRARADTIPFNRFRANRLRPGSINGQNGCTGSIGRRRSDDGGGNRSPGRLPSRCHDVSVYGFCPFPSPSPIEHGAGCSPRLQRQRRSRLFDLRRHRFTSPRLPLIRGAIGCWATSIPDGRALPLGGVWHHVRLDVDLASMTAEGFLEGVSPWARWPSRP